MITRELKNFARNLSVIIVEDDKVLNEEIVNLAKLFFKDVYYAYNGVEALEIYQNNRVDIVITDITMPKMDGVALSARLKQINPSQDIVIISAHRDIDYLVKLIDIGIKQLIYKPFDHQELLYRLLRVCEDFVLLNKSNELEANSLLFPSPKHKEESKTEESLKEFPKKTQSSSLVFSSEFDDDIEYILELRDDLEYHIDMLYNGVEIKHLQKISSLFSKMYTILSQINATAAMSIAVFELANFLENIDFFSLNDEQKSKLKTIEFMYEDISKFIQLVFISQEVKDTAYLESSLRSSVNQLKRDIFDDFLIEEELELF